MRWPRLALPFVHSTQVEATVDADGIDEDGAPVVGATWSGLCNWQDSTATRFSRDRADMEVSATLYVGGDPFPGLWAVGTGTVTVNGEQRRIAKVGKARNPDGSVNFTTIWLR